EINMRRSGFSLFAFCPAGGILAGRFFRVKTAFTLKGEIMANSKLYVGNLSYGTSQEDLEELFGKHGQVTEVRIIRDMNSGQSRGFAFVEMATPADAQKAIEALNGYELQERALVVNEARPKESGGGGRPRGGGRGDRRGGRGGNW